MGRLYDRPVSIQRINDDTEQWEDVYRVHVRVNKSKTDDEYLNGGAVQGKLNLTFEMRYFSGLADIAHNIQRYRILFDGVPYDIKDYDDFMMKHKTVKILGVSY